MAQRKKNALITGGTSGIGFELAKLFAKDGYDLVIVARDQRELDMTKQELESTYSTKVTTLSKDLFDINNAFDVYSSVMEQGIQIDVLVNDAGHGHYGEFEKTNLEMELSIINLNISSLVILTKLFLQDMLARGEGKILNLSSIASKSPGPWQSVYHGTKAFVQSFTEAVREETKDKGIVITALLPGVTNTDFFNKANMTESKIAQDESKMADPADVAKDGYEALMSGKDMVISGFKNKMEVAMNNLSSDEKNAQKMAKQQEPVDHDHHDK
jgi:short-subunit dehydrogenase